MIWVRVTAHISARPSIGVLLCYHQLKMIIIYCLDNPYHHVWCKANVLHSNLLLSSPMIICNYFGQSLCIEKILLSRGTFFNGFVFPKFCLRQSCCARGPRSNCLSHGCYAGDLDLIVAGDDNSVWDNLVAQGGLDRIVFLLFETILLRRKPI